MNANANALLRYNQTMNVAVNFYNGTKTTKQMSWQEIGRAYVPAVVTSCGMSWALSRLASNQRSQLITGAISYTSVAAASIVSDWSQATLALTLSNLLS